MQLFIIIMTIIVLLTKVMMSYYVIQWYCMIIIDHCPWTNARQIINYDSICFFFLFDDIVYHWNDVIIVIIMLIIMLMMGDHWMAYIWIWTTAASAKATLKALISICNYVGKVMNVRKRCPTSCTPPINTFLCLPH